jgi:hypothetical protein
MHKFIEKIDTSVADHLSSPGQSQRLDDTAAYVGCRGDMLVCIVASGGINSYLMYRDFGLIKDSQQISPLWKSKLMFGYLWTTDKVEQTNLKVSSWGRRDEGRRHEGLTTITPVKQQAFKDAYKFWLCW